MQKHILFSPILLFLAHKNNIQTLVPNQKNSDCLLALLCFVWSFVSNLVKALKIEQRRLFIIKFTGKKINIDLSIAAQCKLIAQPSATRGRHMNKNKSWSGATFPIQWFKSRSTRLLFFYYSMCWNQNLLILVICRMACLAIFIHSQFQWCLRVRSHSCSCCDIIFAPSVCFSSVKTIHDSAKPPKHYKQPSRLQAMMLVAVVWSS